MSDRYELIGYMHDGENRVDMIHVKVKELWDKVNPEKAKRYTIEVYKKAPAFKVEDSLNETLEMLTESKGFSLSFLVMGDKGFNLQYLKANTLTAVPTLTAQGTVDALITILNHAKISQIIDLTRCPISHIDAILCYLDGHYEILSETNNPLIFVFPSDFPKEAFYTSCPSLWQNKTMILELV